MSEKSNKSPLALVVTALGVVFGDIGTSPLYAFKETILTHGLPRTEPIVLGTLSLILWSLIIVVAFKYVGLIMRADNDGEGGIFALLGLLRNGSGKVQGKGMAALVSVIIFGAALLYGDGVITPAISVLSAVEGLNVVTPAFARWVVPLSVAILITLFALQIRGTAGVGRLFGPVMIFWFLAIAALAVPHIGRHPEVLRALDPRHAVLFLSITGWRSMVVLGSVVLCITGGEALYADIGHFGRRPIRRAWFSIVLPCLMLNYFGQGARLLDAAPIPRQHLFYALCPEGYLLPMVVLATVATVIASQALISGVYSLTQQAIALGLVPRVKIVHTSAQIKGQIYMPAVNWALCAGCLALVILFQESSRLAAAYGIAVTGTMAVTTLAFLVVAVVRWKWRWWVIGPVCAALLGIDLAFFLSNLLKFFHGGYIPIFLAVALYIVFSTWMWGRAQLALAYAAYVKEGRPMSWLISLKTALGDQGGRLTRGKRKIVEIPRAVVFLVSAPIRTPKDMTPIILRAFIKLNGALPKHLVILNIASVNRPNAGENRFDVIALGANITSVIARFGYMEKPDVRQLLLDLHASRHLPKIKPEAVTVYIGREDIYINATKHGVKFLRASLFQLLNAAARPAHRYFGFEQRDQVSRLLVPMDFAQGKFEISFPPFENFEEPGGEPEATSSRSES